MNQRDQNGRTVLYHLVDDDGRLSFIEELLRAGADANLADKNGFTPCFTAWEPKVLELLIEHGADLRIVNGAGRTPFQHLEWDAGCGSDFEPLFV